MADVPMSVVRGVVSDASLAGDAARVGPASVHSSMTASTAAARAGRCPRIIAASYP